jgi:hypothetical protein
VRPVCSSICTMQQWDAVSCAVYGVKEVRVGRHELKSGIATADFCFRVLWRSTVGGGCPRHVLVALKAHNSINKQVNKS